jgi:cell wall-associated NlpC family hydrolase
MTTRNELIAEARKFIGAKFGHQGRQPGVLDCGGLVLMTGRAAGLTSLEFLSYSGFPSGGRFEQLLREHAVETGYKSLFPHNFDGTEFKPADIVAFDYGNGEGVRHIGFVTRWDGRRYWIIDAQPGLGVTEHPLAFPFTKHGTVIHKYLVKDLSDD